MSTLYPLRFDPILRRYLWGGRRLGTELGKPIGPGDDYAESWEVVDHGADQSRVASGRLAGATLHQLISEHGSELLGRHHPQSRFPLLFKLLDAQRTLSVQVHPNDEQGAKLAKPDYGKTEAWVVLAAQPGSLIYAGLKRGFDRHALAREVSRGTCELCLHHFEPQPGDCIFLPAGVVHAIGAGLLIAEIQQSSDTTFRLFDWNRVGADGKPRELHVEAALDVTDFARGPVDPQTPQATDRPHVERLVTCDKFVLDRWRWSGKERLAGDNRCHLLAVISGKVTIAGDAAARPAVRGECLLAPASCSDAELDASDGAEMLDMYLP